MRARGALQGLKRALLVSPEEDPGRPIVSSLGSPCEGRLAAQTLVRVKHFCQTSLTTCLCNVLCNVHLLHYFVVRVDLNGPVNKV